MAVAKKLRGSPAPRPRAKPAEGPELRRRILRASRVLIEREGLSALSMREVARRAGVSHQAPYNHFEDREAILGALAEEGFAILRDKLLEALNATESDVPGRIRGATRAYVEFAIRHPAHFRLMFRPELVDLNNCPGAKAVGDQVFQMFTALVAEGVQAGLPPEPSFDALVAVGWSVCHGLACLILDGPLARKMPNAQRDTLVAGVTEIFSAMLRARMEQATPKR